MENSKSHGGQIEVCDMPNKARFNGKLQPSSLVMFLQLLCLLSFEISRSALV
jgi:hypothetical protein